MKRCKIEIVLKSDMCPASGSGQGSYIDTDVCCDRFGLPYIPARRLKGCLRDAAIELNDWAQDPNLCNEDGIKRLFGIKGSGQDGTLILSNAVLDNYHKMCEQLNKYSKNKVRLNRIAVINQYTSIRTRTSINEYGTAQNGSLRTIRVINGGNIFIAETEPLDEEDARLLNCFCEALRHMGSNRTRGLGAVRLKCSSIEDKIDNDVCEIFKDCEKIRLHIKLDSPVMVSSNDSEDSLDSGFNFVRVLCRTIFKR